MTRHWTLILVLSAAAPHLAADEAPPVSPSFDMHTTDGHVGTGPVRELRPDWSTLLVGTKPAEAKPGTLVSLRRTGLPLPPFPTGEQVVFVNGDRVPGRVVRLANDRVRVRGDFGGPELSVPVAALSLLWFAKPAGVDDAATFRRRLAGEPRGKDVVLLRNGDVLEGTLTVFDDKTVRLDVGGAETPVERNRVAALALNGELGRSLKPKGSYARAVLTDGCRLSLAGVRGDEAALTGKTLTGASVRLPWDRVAALDVLQGPAVYLSDQKPKRYEHEPYLGVRWPFAADACVSGGDLTLGGAVYDKGIGLHSQARLTYELKGGFRWFEARVGLDDRTGRDGSVTVEVLLDGKPQDLGWVGELHGGGTKAIRLPTNGARELTLVVKFGRRGDVQDHVNWADARLVK
jgi:hypothetical protein